MSVWKIFVLFPATFLVGCLTPLEQVGTVVGTHFAIKTTDNMQIRSYGNSSPDGNSGSTFKKDNRAASASSPLSPPATAPELICTKKGDKCQAISQTEIGQMTLEKVCEKKSKMDCWYYKVEPET
ncbi:hypothetical protein [Kiloniella laminariae]|uniref:hypothetical protein n=1 Tax=Kiloniella laminariae TaxID=454162 RepID=UPI00036D3F0C|nr:hypothetical protein [Kiloniella laminariae]